SMPRAQRSRPRIRPDGARRPSFSMVLRTRRSNDFRFTVIPALSDLGIAPEEDTQPLGAAFQPVAALIQVIGQHDRPPLAIRFGGRGRAVPALLLSYGEGITGRGKEAHR